MAAGRIFGDPFRVDIAQFAAVTQGGASQPWALFGHAFGVPIQDSRAGVNGYEGL
jgi:hypothetical protein